MLPYFSSPIPTLAYHRVLPYKNSMSVTIDEFEYQLKWLKKHGYSTLSGAQFQSAMRGEIDVERAVVLTFDDGYLDNWYLATPLLEKYGMTALLFLITDTLEEQKKRAIGTWMEDGPERYLSWEEVDLMVASGVFEVHTHTHTHTRFWVGEQSAAATKLAVCQDIAASIKTLRDRGYQHELQLAWPWGYFRQDWLADVAAMGINTCYTMRPGTNYPGDDLSVIRRINGDSISKDFQFPFSLARSGPMGRALNGVANVWGGLRGRP
jgi:peptidoglycan/xylan/chitin deacetylase (PgdA/CDA1 family)